jgi:hypothetical protein
MKKVLWSISILVVILATLQVRSLQTPGYHGGPAFAGFPTDVARPVDVGWDDGALSRQSARERRDQVRDWLLLAVVSNAGLPESDVSAALVDLPPARYGYLRPVSAFEYGETRSRSIGGGRVIALVPAEQSEGARADSLAHIADEYRMTVGREAKELLIFEYSIGEDEASATVTRRASIAGASLYTEAAGYHRVTVSDTTSLKRFLTQVDDLLEAQVMSSSLTLAGRKLRSGYRGVTLEDVAALWHSQAEIDDAQRRLQQKIDAFNAGWRSRTYRTEPEKRLLTAQHEREWESLKAQLLAERTVEGSGFSLDPLYDYEALVEAAEHLLPLLKEIAAPSEVHNVLAALRRKDERPFLQLLFTARGRNPSSFAVQLLMAAHSGSQFQAARYDGRLQGTRVGMTLFYTDLLAKLKAIDFWNDVPVADFRSYNHIPVARVYEREHQKLSGTRLWFGPQDRGYRLTSEAISFARDATRIYAASSDPLLPGKEAAPNASSQEFLGWWDDHYAEVAAYEPEYQRLNEIMKWSLVLSWLSAKDFDSNSIGLQKVTVSHDLWFPDWAANHGELRYRNWSRIKFYPRGHKDAATEAMPILYSRADDWLADGDIVSGGVSLGSKTLIKERPLLTQALQRDEIRLRPGVDLAKAASSGSNELSMIGGLKHEFTSAGGRSITRSTSTTAGVKSRAPWTELATRPVERAYQTSQSGLNITVKLENTNLGRFYSDVAIDRPIRVGFRASTVDRGQQFAERASAASSRGADLDRFIAMHPDVELVVKYGPEFACSGCYAVKLRGTDRYMKMQVESTPTADLAPGWQARAGSLERDAKNFNLAWLSPDELRLELKPSEYVRIESTAGGSGGSLPPTFTRGPPAGAPSEWNIGGTKVPVTVDASGVAYIKRANLPSALADDLSAVRRLASHRGGSEPPRVEFAGQPDRRELLTAMLDDPQAAKRALDEAAKTAAGEVDAAIIEGRSVEASARLDRLASVGQSTPDIRIRQSIAAAGENDVQRAVRMIRNAVSAPGDRTRSLDLINQRILTTTSRIEAENLRQLAAMIDLGNGKPFADGRLIAFEVRLAEEAKGTPVAVSTALEGRGPIYVLERPSADPYVATFASLPDQLPRDLGTAVTLPRSDLAHARPRVIQTADGKRYRLVEDRRERLVARTTTPYIRYNSNRPPCASSSPSDRVPASCNEEIYLFDAGNVAIPR